MVFPPRDKRIPWKPRSLIDCFASKRGFGRLRANAGRGAQARVGLDKFLGKKCDGVAAPLYRKRPDRHTVYEALIRILQCNIAVAR